jgi:hypothetical protein
MMDLPVNRVAEKVPDQLETMIFCLAAPALKIEIDSIGIFSQKMSELATVHWVIGHLFIARQPFEPGSGPTSAELSWGAIHNHGDSHNATKPNSFPFTGGKEDHPQMDSDFFYFSHF